MSVAGVSAQTTPRKQARFAIGAAIATAMAIGFLLLPVSYRLQLFAIFVLAWWLPGLLLAALWRLPDTPLPALLLYALGLGMAWLIGLALLAHYLPGGVTRPLLLAIYGAGVLALLVVLWFKQPSLPVLGDRRLWLWAVILLLAAGALRLPGLGYHEFHADEAVLLRQSRRAFDGQEDALAEHTKGPGEIAVAMTVYGALGKIDEAAARAPFALMSVGSVLALAWLGMRMFNGRTGVWAGLLLVANGFALGLSRIAQYQAAVLFFTVLAVLALWEFSRCGRARWLALGAVFSAFGMVMHYEFALLAPALIYLAWRGFDQADDHRAFWATLGVSVLAGTSLVAVAYLPALLNPYFSTTQGYLNNRMGQVGTFNVSFLAEMGTFYNATYYFVGLIVLAVAGTVLGWRRQRVPTVTLTLWWLPFFILYIFVVRYPGTHFYLLMQSWCLLAAIPLAMFSAPQVRAGVRWATYAAAGVWLLVSVYYLYLMFFRQEPEYLINIDSERVPAYWAPFAVPEKPRFGFPIQEGWKAVGVLGQWGYLHGSDGEEPTYNSNDRVWSIRRWYLTAFNKRGFGEKPDYIFVAKHVQEPNPEFDSAILDEYTRSGEVRVRDEPRIEIWSRTPLPAYVVYDAAQLSTPFMDDVSVAYAPKELALDAVDAILADHVRVDGVRIAKESVTQGDTLEVVLSWTPLQPLERDYKVFVHVADALGRPVAQWDGFPGLNTARTSTWPVNQPFLDRVFVRIPEDAPPGEYRLLTGMYDPESGDRIGDAISIGAVTVR